MSLSALNRSVILSPLNERRTDDPVPAAIATSAYRPVPRGCDLHRVCAFHYLRQCLDGSWRVYVGDRLVTTTPAPPDPGQLRARKRR